MKYEIDEILDQMDEVDTKIKPFVEKECSC